MKYRILMRLRKTGNFYYFSHWDDKDPRIARGVTALYRHRSVLFPSVKAACAVVRRIDPVKYRVLIVRDIKDDRKEREFCLNFAAEELAMKHLKEGS